MATNKPAKRAGRGTPAPIKPARVVLERDAKPTQLGGRPVHGLRAPGSSRPCFSASEVARWIGYADVSGLTTLAERHEVELGAHRWVDAVSTEHGPRKVTVYTRVGAIKLALLSELAAGRELRDRIAHDLDARAEEVEDRGGSRAARAQVVLGHAFRSIEEIRAEPGPKAETDALTDVLASQDENGELLELYRTKRLPRAAGSVALGPQVAFLLGAKRPNPKPGETA